MYISKWNMTLNKKHTHPECVVLLGQIWADMWIRDCGFQKLCPKSSQLSTELRQSFTDLFCYLLMTALQLQGERELKLSLI